MLSGLLTLYIKCVRVTLPKMSVRGVTNEDYKD